MLQSTSAQKLRLPRVLAEPQASSRRFSDPGRVPQDAGLGSAVGATSAAAGYTSLNSGGYESTSRSTGNSASDIPEDSLNTPGSKGYQPNMSTAVDSMRTAAEKKNLRALMLEITTLLDLSYTKTLSRRRIQVRKILTSRPKILLVKSVSFQQDYS